MLGSPALAPIIPPESVPAVPTRAPPPLESGAHLLAHRLPAFAPRRLEKKAFHGLPNGSRLSCGRNARRRKVAERQIKRLAGEATQFFPPERPTASSAC